MATNTTSDANTATLASDHIKKQLAETMSALEKLEIGMDTTLSPVLIPILATNKQGVAVAGDNSAMSTNVYSPLMDELMQMALGLQKRVENIANIVNRVRL